MNELDHPLTAPVLKHPAVWALDASLVAFGATMGVLLAFGFGHGGMFAVFALVGRRVARDIMLPYWGEATLGVAIHLGEMLVLGLLAAMFAVTLRVPARLRVAVFAVIVWEIGGMFTPFAVLRPDVVANLAWIPRIGLAMLLVAALTYTPHRTR